MTAIVDEMALEEEFARATLKRATLKRLIGYLLPYWPRLVFAFVLEFIWVVSMLVDPRLIRLAVDGPLAAGDVSGAWAYGGWILLNLVFRAGLTAWELRVLTQTGTIALHAVRKDVFDHIQRLSMRYFDRTKQGRIIARADRDVDTLEHMVIWGPIVLVSLLLSMVLGFIQIVRGHAALGVWLAAAIPLVWLTTRTFKNLGFPAYRRVRETHSAISAHVAETITGVRVVKAFSAEGRELSKLRGLQQAYRAAVLYGVRVASAYIPALSVTFHGVMIVILVLGGTAVVRGEIQLGELLEFVLLLGFVLGPVEGLGGLYNESLVAGAAAERIFLLLDTEPEVKDHDDARDPGELRGDVHFDNVWFSYDPEARNGWQLEDVEFEVPAGTTVALVGHTGAGKTSIINLLARFYEAQRGVVRVDGEDIRKYTLDGLHRQMGTVLQENYLFNGTVLDNLRFVQPDLTEEQAQAGFDELGCTAVLAQLKDGLSTEVGERGANLSEGERQIVCFVRALIASPSLLVLDEATSAVDTRTEALLLTALRKLASRQTTFIIAHRLSTIRHADLILVMDHGKVVERGTHEELLRANGAYMRLYAEYSN